MGCVGMGINQGIRQPRLSEADALSRKRQMLVDYALRNKIAAIIDIVNSRTPFDSAKELTISIVIFKCSKHPDIRNSVLGLLSQS